MKVLAIETTTRIGSVAIMAANKIRVEFALSGEMNHSEKLLPGIERALTAARLGYRDLDRVAVSIGPGSFTGLRIGLTVARTIGQIMKIEVVGVPTLDCLAAQAGHRKELVCPLIAGIQHQVYYSFYQSQTGKGLRKTGNYRLASTAELINRVKRLRQGIIFTGEGLSTCRAELERALSGQARFASASVWRPRASRIAELSSAYRTCPWPQLKPLYIRPSEAELNWHNRS